MAYGGAVPMGEDGRRMGVHSGVADNLGRVAKGSILHVECGSVVQEVGKHLWEGFVIFLQVGSLKPCE